MTPLLALLSLFWLAEPAPVKAVPPPPGGKFEAEMTKVVSDRAKVEMKALLDQLEQYNCARYNLARGMTQRWIDAGRRR